MVMDQLKLAALRRLPKNLVSRAFGAVCEVEFPTAVQRTVNKTFASYAGIDITEGEHPPEDYATLNAFFTRRLRQGARAVESDLDDDLVSPVDGKIGAFGAITNNTLLQAKGREYRLVELVDSGEEAARFCDGHYMTIYLSPRDYHRIHSPNRGQVTKVSYIPGYLFPVNPLAVENIDNLFAVNERLISYMQTPTLGSVGVVKVGATCVGKIGLAFDRFLTNCKLRRRQDFAPADELTVQHGDELGVFNLGSTVILLISSPDFAFEPSLQPGQMLKMGEVIGRSTAPTRP